MREKNLQILEQHLNIRKKYLIALSSFSLIDLNNNIQKIIEELEVSLKDISIYKENFKGLREFNTISAQEISIRTLYHFLKWAEKTLNAQTGEENEIKSAKNQIDLLKSSFKGVINLVKYEKRIIELLDKYYAISNIEELEKLIREFIKLPVPIYYSKFKEPLSESLFVSLEDENSEVSDEDDFNPNVIKVQLSLDDLPWGNLQIIKPGISYQLTIEIEIPEWPFGFETLEILPSSTYDSKLFSFGKISIIRDKNKQQKNNLTTSIFFKVPQNNSDPPIEIKLFANFISKEGKTKNVTIIGYHKLKIKVSSKEDPLINSGFKDLDELGNRIIRKLESELPNLNQKELKDFSILLSGLLNYQGTCLKQGLYKNQGNINENRLKDNIIQHLQSNPLIGEEIIEESHVAGGKVEISFRSIITELKVEKKVKSTKAIFKKYQKQPVCYSSGFIKQLAIVCILNLTEKNNPPANPKNEIEVLTPELHGFENEACNYPTKIIGIIIQGNLKNPSNYSK